MGHEDVPAEGADIRKVWSRANVACIVGLFLFVVVSRVFLLSDKLVGIDPVQNALSLNNYDVLHHMPHPPGAPTYHALLHLVQSIVHDANDTVLVTGVVLAVFACFSTWTFGWSMPSVLGQAYPSLVALLLLVLPGLWADSVSGGSCAGDAALAALLGVFSIRAQAKGKLFDVVAGAITLGILIGFRQNANLASMCLMPLWVWSIWRVQWSYRIVGSIALIVTCATWTIPTAVACGGWEQWIQPLIRHTKEVNSTGLLLGGVSRSTLVGLVHMMAKNMRSYICFLWIPVFYMGFRCLLTREWRRAREITVTFLWVGPLAIGASIAPYHMNEYFAVAAPLVCWWAAVGLASLAETLSRLGPRLGAKYKLMPRYMVISAWLLASVATVVISHTLLMAKFRPSDHGAVKYYTIAQRVSENFSPQNTLILNNNQLGRRYMMLSLPAYMWLDLPVLHAEEGLYAGVLFYKEKIITFTDQTGIVPSFGRQIRTLVIIEPTESIICVPPLAIDASQGIFSFVHTDEGELSLHYASHELIVSLADKKNGLNLSIKGVRDETRKQF